MAEQDTAGTPRKRKITKTDKVDWNIELRTNDIWMAEYTIEERKRSQENQEERALEIRRHRDLVCMEREEACANRERICSEREGACEEKERVCSEREGACEEKERIFGEKERRLKVKERAFEMKEKSCKERETECIEREKQNKVNEQNTECHPGRHLKRNKSSVPFLRANSE